MFPGGQGEQRWYYDRACKLLLPFLPALQKANRWKTLDLNLSLGRERVGHLKLDEHKEINPETYYCQIVKNKRQFWSRLWRELSHLRESSAYQWCFQPKPLQSRRELSDIFKVLKEKQKQVKNTIPSKTIINDEAEIKTFQTNKSRSSSLDQTWKKG